jgi:hypothetical protein
VTMRAAILTSSPTSLYCGTRASDFVAGKVIRDDRGAGRKGRAEYLFDVGEENGAIHGAVDNERGSKPGGS